MSKPLGGKFKSIRLRLLFTFFLLVCAVFSNIGYFLDYRFGTQKVVELEQRLETQTKIFELCTEGKDKANRQLISQCYASQKVISEHTSFYWYRENDTMIAQSRASNKQLLIPASIYVEIKESLQQNSVTFFEADGFYYYASVLNDNSMLLLSYESEWISRDVGEYQSYLYSALFIISLLLIIGFYLIVRIGLRPLDHMVVDLEEIAKGNLDQLKSQYGSEFDAMSLSLNNLLNAERMQRERYRNTLADLAHSLKTPLAVIQGAANEGLDFQAYNSIIGEQVRRMDQIIQYQLTRAVKSIGDGAKTNAVEVAPIVERILSALGKVYREKEVRVVLNLEPKIAINADERDLMEMLGNMMENAFKYCRSEVAVSLYSDENNIYIDLEDDGAGVSENMRNTILERGERADTSAAPGQGIGLSVSVDILSSYNCRLEVEDSFSLGGAKFSVTFPKH